MGSTGKIDCKGIDATVGGLVWVHRPNGSWWPGQIIGLDELPAACLVSQKSGTPVKLLGREDANIDWYNLEKSKRVKAFRCGDYDEYIEKAKASRGHSNKKAGKYASRKDAILRALELESARSGAWKVCTRKGNSAGAKHEKLARQPRNNHGPRDYMPRDVFNTETRPTKELSVISSEQPNQRTASQVHILQKMRRKISNNSENDDNKGSKRMRGLQDLGLRVVSKEKPIMHCHTEGSLEIVLPGSIPLNESNIFNSVASESPISMVSCSSLKRRCTHAFNVNEIFKRKHRHRPLAEVLESTAKVNFHSACDRDASPSRSSIQSINESKSIALEGTESKNTRAIAISMASSLSPPGISMELHAQNRARVVQSLRENLLSSSRPLHGFVFLQGGEEQTRYCTDHVILFRQESFFAYLFGVREPGFYGAIDVASGKSILFAPRLSVDYAVWLGEIKPPSYFKERYMVDLVCYTDEIVSVLLHQHRGGGKPILFLLHGLNTDSNKFCKPAELGEMEKFDTDLSTLHPVLTECRILKSDMELALIQYANDVSSEAHVEVMRKTRVGMKEYQLESTFLHHIYMYGGCRHCSYTCICASGENSSVLHYGHAAAPNERILNDGDMALLDMGAEYHFYGSDITCSFPVNGKFTSDQSLVYNAVLKAHNVVLSTMKPGVSWIDMHKLAEKTILESLRTGGLIFGDVDDMMAERLGAVFMPHGLGHFLGIDTHDPGGYTKELERPKEPGLRALRTIRELQEGMVITVEPGCYFIDALLNPALEGSSVSKFFNHKEISRFKNFGGVRIESDVHVTSSGCKNLTNCPRETWEIEAVMAGALWPLEKDSQP